MASGRSARLPPTPQPQQPAATSASTGGFLSISEPTARYGDVSPNNNHHPSVVGPLTGTGTNQNQTQYGSGFNSELHHHYQVQQQQQQQQFQYQQQQQQTPLILDNNNSEANCPFATQVLDSLTERERRMIINVLKRDENVRQRDAARIMWVKNWRESETVRFLWNLQTFLSLSVSGRHRQISSWRAALMIIILSCSVLQ